MKKMRYTKTHCRSNIKDLLPPRAPAGVSQYMWSRGHGNKGNGAELGWYRGHQAGLYDAYRALRSVHPRIAEEFRSVVGIDKDGSIEL